MDTDYIFKEAAKVFQGNNILLIPCLYIILWLLNKENVLTSVPQVVHCIILFLGIAFSVLLNGFTAFNVLLGFFSGGMAVFLYTRTGKKDENDGKHKKDKNTKKK